MGQGCKNEEKKGILGQGSSTWEDPEPCEGVSHAGILTALRTVTLN